VECKGLYGLIIGNIEIYLKIEKVGEWGHTVEKFIEVLSIHFNKIIYVLYESYISFPKYINSIIWLLIKIVSSINSFTFSGVDIILNINIFHPHVLK
jgi:hypothetical protein